MSQRGSLEADAKKHETFLRRVCHAASSDTLVAWVHLKAVRVFVEAVLRFGVPPNFAAFLLKPAAGAAKQTKLRTELNDVSPPRGSLATPTWARPRTLAMELVAPPTWRVESITLTSRSLLHLSSAAPLKRRRPTPPPPREDMRKANEQVFVGETSSPNFPWHGRSRETVHILPSAPFLFHDHERRCFFSYLRPKASDAMMSSPLCSEVFRAWQIAM